MKYITSIEMANKTGKTKRWINECCAKGIIEGAFKEGNRWMIPDNAKWEVGIDGRSPLPIGVSDFELAISDYYYVDKTLLIKDLIDYRPQVSLFLRPRRFGKTLNMDMIKTFFEKRDEAPKGELFVGTKIWNSGRKYINEQGKYPVIFLTFKDVKFHDWSDTFTNLKSLIQQEYKRHIKVIYSDKIQEIDKKYFNSVLSGDLEEALWPSTLGRLSEMLHLVEGTPAMILIDEYDTPIQQGHLEGYYDDVIGFMRNLLSGGLKDNKHLSMAFLTGILRVAKESIFSGLNNLDTSSVLERRYSQYFGFTEDEVKKILKDYGQSARFSEVKEWYDGYVFGDTEIYNPWSVLNYVNKDCVPMAYWQSTGSNEIIGEVLNASTVELTDEVRALLQGEQKSVYVDTAVIYPEVKRNPSSVYSFLLMSGYLTVDDTYLMPDGNYLCRLKIPNKEIQVIYDKEILMRIGSVVTQELSIGFQTALLLGDSIKIQTLLQEFLRESISFYDAANESFYHGLLLGLVAALRSYYEITSNREAGDGRFDIRLKARDISNPHFIIEVKALVGDYKDDQINSALEKEAEVALKQIDDKNYCEGLSGDIRKMGVAFWKKRCAIVLNQN